MSIFGSLINGNFSKKSDIDILIEYNRDSKKSLLDMIFLEEKLTNLFKKKVDLLTKESLSPYLKDYILRSAKVIYERK
jgi:predicted nucleotidyltransferase